MKLRSACSSILRSHIDVRERHGEHAWRVRLAKILPQANEMYMIHELVFYITAEDQMHAERTVLAQVSSDVAQLV